ncbi:MAG TPA: hypothetical protein VMD99_11045 [Terriglobales bacterium]|nr:hypothetical protein [Terriglobales bacterium]
MLAILIPRASAQDIFVTPVPNAPFNAVVDIERSVVQRDGRIFELKSFRQIGRDSSGRIHNERRMFIPASSDQTPQLIRVHLFDPQSRVSTWINIGKKTFWTTTGNHPPATEPPSIRFAAPDGNAPPNEFTKNEDLGVAEVDGVPAHGIRETQIVVDENTGKDVVVTDEYWYSQDLRINLLIKHSDPRKGTTTMTVTQIQQTAPDPQFFEIPEGYKQRGTEQ